jgi:hypothetical protein
MATKSTPAKAITPIISIGQCGERRVLKICVTAELQASALNLPDQAADAVWLRHFDARPVHAGIDVHKDTNSASAPLCELVVVLSQNGDFRPGHLICDFTHTTGIGPHDWICEKNIRSAGIARSDEL